MKVYVNWDEQVVYNQEDYDYEVEEIATSYEMSVDKFNQFVKEETSLNFHDIFQFDENDKNDFLESFKIYCRDLAMEKAENDFEEFDI